MTKENTDPKPTGAVTGGSEENVEVSWPEGALTANCSATDRGTSGHVEQRPVSKKSEAIIREVSVRRRTAMKVLANR